jgi:NAD(P)-dependent dehydrogenase (short-subunit alcohol dehydrogenase family)
MTERMGSAIVTGAGQGIGRAIAVALGAQGTRVAAIARTLSDLEETVRLIADQGGTSVAIVADVTVERDVKAAFARAAAQLGPPDLLVNNAGGSHAIGPLWELELDHWWADVELNLKGAVICTKLVLPHMLSQGWGRIVNLVSASGANPVPAILAYSSAKAGLFAFGEGLARSLTDTGICVFSLSPGMVATEGALSSMRSEAGLRWMPEMVDAVLANGLKPERAAEWVLALNSGQFDTLTGRYIHASDDPELLSRRAPQIVSDDNRVLRLHL